MYQQRRLLFHILLVNVLVAANNISDFKSQKKLLRIINNEKIFKVYLPTVVHDVSRYENSPKVEKVKINHSDEPIVDTSEGTIRGSLVKKKDLKYYTFLGVPYAAKPQRFQAPKRHESWSGVRDAFKVGDNCKQIMEPISFERGSEDCLYINVNTPTIEAKKLPVFVWVYGGENAYGTGDTGTYGPDKLMRQNVVYVSFNYRVGVFGFFSTLSKHAPGNAGIKDIIEALRWIQRNIEQFGGDKDNVSLYGISSSAILIDMLTVSPMTKGLFAKAIIQSGTLMAPYKLIDTDPIRKAFLLGVATGTKTDNPDKLIEHLNGLNSSYLYKESKKSLEKLKPFGLRYLPVIEREIEGVEAFLTEDPEDLLRAGESHDVQYMFGINSLEGTFALKGISDVQSYSKIYTKGYMKLLNMTDASAERLMKFYFKGGEKNLVKDMMTFVGDTGFLYPTHQSIKCRLNSTKPIYFWHFAFDTDYSKVIRTNKLEGIKGPGHAENIPFVFETELNYQELIDNRTQLAIDRTMAILGNFMRYGNPTPTTTKLLPVKWTPVGNKGEFNCMKQTDRMRMVKNQFKKRFEFLDKFYGSLEKK